MEDRPKPLTPTLASTAGGRPVPRRATATSPLPVSPSSADVSSLPVRPSHADTETGTVRTAHPRTAVSVHDVAAYILAQAGRMTAMKLQKLVYYSQAWSLVWDEKPLFGEQIEAWANGPVVPALYDAHRGRFELGPPWTLGDPALLSQANRETIDAVLEFYGKQTSQWLSDLAHQEAPWREARAGLGPQERGNQVITNASLAEYYSSLPS